MKYYGKIEHKKDLVTKEYVDNADILKQDKALSMTITLLTNGWENEEQTVNASIVTVDNIVFVSPEPTSIKSWSENYVICSKQGNGTLTFTCDTVPTEDIGVGVVCL